MKKLLFIIPALLLLSSCATQPLPDSGDPGFLSGIFHGFISPLSLIGSIFMDIRVYAFPNSGFWYDFGFMIGIALLGGGGAGASKYKKE